MMRALRNTIFAAACALSALAGPCWPVKAMADVAVDLELVLAVDASGSVDPDEYALQLGGIAAALRDPDVVAAIGNGPHGRIAVALVVWADASRPVDASAWYVIATAGDAEAAAQAFAAWPRRVVGATGIGAGLAAAMRAMERNGIRAERQVVDVSGDGIETPPRDIVVLIDTANAMAEARGVTVNGLAILNEEPELARWYRDNVLAGRDAFVMTAAGYEDFAVAMKAKLLREIDGLPNLAAACPIATTSRSER
ncbi:MAG: DUF1194 domain-containing protein [Rhodobiaceae bacterium]|nr:DUF1194 domain-containing protein [Rhodobiaceae bacterium]MCC0040955.1 DUF1194 domain-containing protein [Rhodobiaceae bacterium]